MIWTKEDGRSLIYTFVAPNNYAVILHMVSTEDGGLYVCKKTNKMEKFEEHTLLHVASKFYVQNSDRSEHVSGN